MLALLRFGTQLLRLKEQISEFDRMIMAWHRSSERVSAPYIPGSVRCWRPLWSRALLTRTFRSGRNFSTWIGLVPEQHSSRGKDRLGSISEQGDRYLAACSWLARSPSSAMPRSMVTGIGPGSRLCWPGGQQGRRSRSANKIARIAWAMMARGERYKEPVALAR